MRNKAFRWESLAFLVVCSVAVIVVLLLSACSSSSNELVTRAIDGDTVDTMESDVNIRPLGIQAPERGQCWSEESTEFARDELVGKIVRLYPDDTQATHDRYGRKLRFIEYDDIHNFSLVSVANGHAKVYEPKGRTMHHDKLIAAQSNAQSAQLGLWAPKPKGCQ